MMKFDASIVPDDLNAVPDLARKMEDVGFAALWTPETSHNAFLPLTLAAYSTDSMEIGTSIAVAFPRSPMTMAYMAWDLATQSKGRFLLGLGTQVKAHIERRFGMEWFSPGPRLRDYVLALRAIWHSWQHNEKLSYEGEFYQHTLMTPFFQPEPLENPDIPIYIAGVNQYLCQLAGELGDGFHVHPFHTADYLRDEIIGNVTVGAEKAGRSRKDVSMTCAIFVATGKDAQEIENAKVMVKSQVAFYASTPSYKAVLDHHGMGDLQVKMREMTKAGKWMEMWEHVPEELFDKVCVSGDYEELPHKVKERYDGLLDRVAYYMPYIPGENEELWQASLKVLAN
jgi:probable F420-dependent oxidoreductase